MKRLLLVSLVLFIFCALVACRKTPKTEYHPSGFDGDKLYINVNGDTLIYERYAAGIGSLSKKAVLDRFETETEIETIVWDICSTEEHPDLSYILVISGTNIYWTYRISDSTT